MQNYATVSVYQLKSWEWTLVRQDVVRVQYFYQRHVAAAHGRFDFDAYAIVYV